MGPAPGPSSGALALAALTQDAVMTRIWSRLDRYPRMQLRSVSKDVRDACDRQVKKLALPSHPDEQATALPALYGLMRRGMHAEDLDLEGLREDMGSSANVAAGFL
jgi:hypothetical protein